MTRDELYLEIVEEWMNGEIKHGRDPEVVTHEVIAIVRGKLMPSNLHTMLEERGYFNDADRG